MECKSEKQTRNYLERGSTKRESQKIQQEKKCKKYFWTQSPFSSCLFTLSVIDFTDGPMGLDGPKSGLKNQ